MSTRSPRIRVALAGAGMVSAHHLRGWAATPGSQVVAIADPDRSRATERAAEFGVPRVFDDAESMLDAVRPDALDIASPPQTHVELCRQAARRAVAILCQKPFAPTLAEARAYRAEHPPGVPLMVHENWRFRPWYRRVREWLGEGRIGAPRAVRMRVASSGLLPDAQGRAPGLLRQPSLAPLRRLMVGELLIHHLDVLRWLFGPLEVSSARLARRSERVVGEDFACIELGAAGMPIRLEGDWMAAGAPVVPADDLEIDGARARMVFRGEALSCLAADARTGEGALVERFDLDGGYAGSYAAAIGHFVAGLRSGEAFETPLSDNLETLALVEAVYAAAPPAQPGAGRRACQSVSSWKRCAAPSSRASAK